MKRRDLLLSLGLTSLGLPAWKPGSSLNTFTLPEEMTILFQGDSITDAGRERAWYYANNSRGMGGGYVRHIVTELLGLHPGKKLNVYNRGISGNKVFQLADRWTEDCLQLEPDVLSLLIGVNDFWHTLSHGYQGTAEVYEGDLRKLLDITFSKLPDVIVLLGEPFVLLEGTAINSDKWQSDFPKYREAARKVAEDYDATFIPYQSVFEQALQRGSTSYWCPDGVHPSMAGNYLMANAWLQGFYSLFED